MTRTPDGHNYNSIKASGDSGLVAGDVHGNFIINYEQQKTNPFSKLTEQQRRIKLHEFARDGAKSSLANLLQLPVDLDHKSTKGNTALHKALQNGHNKCATLLVKAGSDVNAAGEGGCTPWSLSMARGDAKMTELLFENGAYIDEGASFVVGGSRKQRHSIMKVLVEHKANMWVGDRCGRTILNSFADEGYDLIVGLSQEYIWNHYGASQEEWTAVVEAMEGGREGIVRLLLDIGRDTEAGTPEKWTVLMVAAGHGYSRIVEALIIKASWARRR